MRFTSKRSIPWEAPLRDPHGFRHQSVHTGGCTNERAAGRRQTLGGTPVPALALPLLT